MPWFFREKVNIPEIPGAVPSPFDIRDIPLSAVQTPIELRELPENYIIPYKLRISDQNGYPHCVGYSAATLKEEKERREQLSVDFDGDWIYRKCKEIDGYNGPGTYLRIAMKVLQKDGAKSLDGSKEDAQRYKIGGYARVDDLSFEGLKRAIYQNGAIMAGFYGDNEGWKTAYIKPPKERKWGHAVTLIGFNKGYIVGQNSWGEDWGDRGIFYICPQYQPFESWAVLVDLPNDFQRADRPKHIFSQDLRLGMRNSEVVWLQKCLKYLGCFPQIIDTTGFFGQITLRAVQLFQQSYNISPASGFVGPITRAKLNEIFS
jgi:peptidoglycan hydrolase-like protein with peptidoglycan-binding domain